MAEKKKSFLQKIVHNQEMGARRSLLEDMFNDYYKERRKIYKMSFIKGIFSGLGAVIGGTVIVAIIVLILSFFVNLPGIGKAAQQAQNSLQTSSKK